MILEYYGMLYNVNPKRKCLVSDGNTCVYQMFDYDGNVVLGIDMRVDQVDWFQRRARIAGTWNRILHVKPDNEYQITCKLYPLIRGGFVRLFYNIKNTSGKMLEKLLFKGE
jgi:hypothetical protein